MTSTSWQSCTAVLPSYCRELTSSWEHLLSPALPTRSLSRLCDQITRLVLGLCNPMVTMLAWTSSFLQPALARFPAKRP
jgi:hypothetical protein